MIKGWTSRHDDIRVEKKDLSVCRVQQTLESYKLWEHRETKLRTRSRSPLPLEPTSVERQAWSNLLSSL